MPSFQPGRLRLARALKRRTQSSLGEEVAAPPSTISRIENGKQEPDEILIGAFADALDVDEAFFFRPLEEVFKRSECSFRHLQSTSKKLLDQVMARGTLLHEAVHALTKVAEFPPVDVPSIRAADSAEIEQAAKRARVHWGLGAGPITNAIRLAENAGVLVMRLQGRTDKVDAFSRQGEPPVILLTSTKDSASRDRFNVAHELGHLVMHRDVPTGDSETEKQANRFAGAFLLSKEGFTDDFLSIGRVDWPSLFELKRRWLVSVAAIIMRAHQLDLIGTAHYRRLQRYYYWKKWNKGEPYEPPYENPELFKLALRVASDDFGMSLSHIAQNCGWDSRETIYEITGIQLPRPMPGENVTRIDDYRRDA